MKILLSNDDGIDAPGLKLLEAVARHLSDDVWVVAPTRKHTAASHRLTCGLPFDIEAKSDRRYACAGSPADCIVAAMTHIFAPAEWPDLVLSGINAGRNVAEDCAYSGTLAIAREATFWEIPAIGLSRPKTAPIADNDPSRIARILHPLIALIPEWHGGRHFLGINLPDQLPAGGGEIAVATPGHDKIAYRCEVVETNGNRTSVVIPRGRRYASSAGDQNAVLAAGKIALMRYDAFSQAPLSAEILQHMNATTSN